MSRFIELAVKLHKIITNFDACLVYFVIYVKNWTDVKYDSYLTCLNMLEIIFQLSPSPAPRPESFVK